MNSLHKVKRSLTVEIPDNKEDDCSVRLEFSGVSAKRQRRASGLGIQAISLLLRAAYTTNLGIRAISYTEQQNKSKITHTQLNFETILPVPA